MPRGVPDNLGGWVPAEQSGYEPPASVGSHLHTPTDIQWGSSTSTSTFTEFSKIIPSGTIWLWYGLSTNVPAGWAICDGSNGTPNLRGRVPVGVDGSQAEFDVLGETGGAKTVALTTAELASHGHTQNGHDHILSINQLFGSSGNNNNDTGSAGVHFHPAAIGNVGYNFASHSHNGRTGFVSEAPWEDFRSDGADIPVNVSSDGSHAHSMNNHSHNVDHNHSGAADSTTATNQNTGSGTAHNNLQPYLALHFIMKL